MPTKWEYEEVPEYNKINYEKAKRRLRTTNRQNVISNEGNVDVLLGNLYSILKDITSETIPTRKKRRNITDTKYPVWFNPHLKNLKNRKQKAHKLYKIDNNETNLHNYLDITEQFSSAIKTAEEEYNR